MRRLILLIIALATLMPSFAQAYDVLVLQSRRDPSYDEVLKGFRFAQKSSLRMLVLSDYAEVNVARVVREDRPRMILAIGDAALKEARKIRNIPVLAVMTLAVESLTASQANLTGISMYVSPERYMDLFQSIKVNRVGVVYNSARSGRYLKLAQEAARQADIQLVIREVSTPRETLAMLSDLNGKVDALWMLPDATAVTREATEFYFRFGQENSVPVISFSSSYLGLGAALSLDIDYFALGRQADSIAAEILSGRTIEDQVVCPSKVTLKRSNTIMNRLRL